MNKIWLGAGAALLLGGCASVEMAQYTVTSFAEIPLKKQAKVKIVANNDTLSPVTDALKAAFQKSGSFNVVEKDADYWFVLSGEDQYVKSAPQQKVAVVKQENDRGGTEVFAASTRNLASAAKGVSVAVYEAKTLAPINYLEIPVYAGDNTEGVVRDESAYGQAFSKEVVERVMDAFITQQKQVETPMPLEADPALRALFVKGGEAYAKGDKNAYTPFLQKYKQLGTCDLAKLCEQLRTNTYQEKDADLKLGNYYLYLLVKETQTLNPEALKKIKNEQFLILRSSQAKGLAEAVPVALARLEYKLANLGE